MTQLTKQADSHSKALFELTTITAIFAIFTWGMSIWTLNNLEKIKTDDWNAIALSMSVLQTLLALLAFLGFWMVRNASRDAAKDEAKKICDEIAAKAIDDAKVNTRLHVNTTLTQFMQSDEGTKMIREQIRQLEVSRYIPQGAVDKVKSANVSETKPFLPSMQNDPNGVDWKKSIGKFAVPNTNLEENDG